MIFEVTLTHTAVETYESIFSQIEEKFGKSSAVKFEQKVFHTLKILAQTPFIFKATEENPSIRKGLINANCSFFYIVTESEVQILFFWDNRQEPMVR